MTVRDTSEVDEAHDRRGWRHAMTSADASGGVVGLYQIALGLAILIVWQFASGRLVDTFIISDPVDIADRLWEWLSTGSIWPHVWATE